jgi:NhaP-type Na+/H+ and K+/H+ antiporter
VTIPLLNIKIVFAANIPIMFREKSEGFLVLLVAANLKSKSCNLRTADIGDAELVRELDCVEDVLRNHMYRQPIFDNIVRMNEALIFEHETKLPNGNWLLIIYRYNLNGELTIDKIFDKAELFSEVTEKYKNHPNVVSAIQVLSQEIKDCDRVTVSNTS